MSQQKRYSLRAFTKDGQLVHVSHFALKVDAIDYFYRSLERKERLSRYHVVDEETGETLVRETKTGKVIKRVP